MTTPLTARDLFRRAYENRYTWDRNFPGYTAEVQWKRGEAVASGTVRIHPDLSVEVMGVADETTQAEIQGQLREIVIHRVRRSFEDTHGKNSFEYGATDETGAVEILVSGKAMGDRYKVRNNEVCMVHRQIHGVVVTINTFSSQQTGTGYLSHRYDSVYHDGKTGVLKGASQFEDQYQPVGNYHILTRRVIQSQQDGQSITTEFAFSKVQILEPVAV
ncbi:hypothetical protein DO97_05480 [Neosynechococcus sphagnicola sy1]|uniref:DUF3386 domain-containing protein n=1 Tax=Neosynechococcus sphagnicola sy1 TaxID=1497020 RepID=A0A098TLM3_9CYAN|nr:DUF3386 domain-containing protein [Neosynechococcus sphagnicola]KGF72772.1 hypothetical protein DO97_05480 [Neosynechococcus sphagnicola sy1]